MDYKDIAGGLYRIYRDGRLWSCIQKRFLTDNGTNTKGYIQNRIMGRHMMRHRLVARAFIENPRPELFVLVDHKDGCKTNNHASNLRFVDNQLNTLNRRQNPIRKGRREKKFRVELKWNRCKGSVNLLTFSQYYDTSAKATEVIIRLRKEFFDKLYAWHTRPMACLPPGKWRISENGIAIH